MDAKKVGIEGVSRYGKAALVTMAYDQRFAVVLVGSSGEGGAKLHRRNFGEAVENLTGSGEYHWMAGNFLKYGTAESTFGSKNAGDIPVDAHQLIALCAPRLTFISYGVPERGDAKWLDQQGSYMAAVAAQPVFRLLGAKDLGVSDDYMKEKMPAVNVEHARRPARLAPARRRPHRRSELEVLHPVGGQVPQAHAGGERERRPIVRRQHGVCARLAIVLASAASWPSPPRPYAQRRRRRSSPAAPMALPIGPAPRTDQNSMTAHAQLLEKARAGRIDVYFVGDSITRRWGATDYPELLANWRQNFFGWNAGNFGWGADRTAEHPLAPRERRARRRQSEGHRDPGRHQQRRRAAWRRRRRSPRSRAGWRRFSSAAGRRRRTRRSS